MCLVLRQGVEFKQSLIKENNIRYLSHYIGVYLPLTTSIHLHIIVLNSFVQIISFIFHLFIRMRRLFSSPLGPPSGNHM
jgi:hypothetical protein